MCAKTIPVINRHISYRCISLGSHLLLIQMRAMKSRIIGAHLLRLPARNDLATLGPRIPI